MHTYMFITYSDSTSTQGRDAGVVIAALDNTCLDTSVAQTTPNKLGEVGVGSLGDGIEIG